MAFNSFNPFYPATYQPMQYPAMQAPAAPGMTPPTIRAEIVQVDGEQAAAAYPVGVGASQMMIARDDSAIFVKTALANGQWTLDVFVKRTQAATEKPVDVSEFVTRAELEKRLSELQRPRGGKKTEKEEGGDE